MKTAITGIVFFIFLSCGSSNVKDRNQQASRAELEVCDNPDADIRCCFINMPSVLSNTLIVSTTDEIGDKLKITGTFFKADGKTPYPNIILYAYHTDNKGYYSKSGTETGVQKWHGRLHGWCKTGIDGRYEIQTIRPARYPDNSIPAHIHAAVKTENGSMKWINDFVFNDDNLVNEKYLSVLQDAGGTGALDLIRTSENSWTGTRDIILK